VIEGSALPWWERGWRTISALLGLHPASQSMQTWLWVVLGAVLVGLVALFFLWAMLLRSGEVVFR
jgi:hypothetical protein